MIDVPTKTRLGQGVFYTTDQEYSYPLLQTPTNDVERDYNNRTVWYKWAPALSDAELRQRAPPDIFGQEHVEQFVAKGCGG